MLEVLLLHQVGREHVTANSSNACIPTPSNRRTAPRKNPQKSEVLRLRPCFPADTVSKVIHQRRKQAVGKPASSSAPLVNNFAARAAAVVNNLPSVHRDSRRKAPRPVRSLPADPPRIQRRKPAGPRAPVPRSENAQRVSASCEARSATLHSAGAQNDVPRGSLYQLDRWRGAGACAPKTMEV